jgi:hypothetical protein
MSRFAIILFITCFILCSCRKISSFSGPDLRFSEDTIRFDTVFSSVGSFTRELRIVNPGRNSLLISHLYLGGGVTSQFRLNIDGEPVNEKYNLEIEPGDSIFIFVDLFVDPGNGNSPISVNDSVIFEFGEKYQKVLLSAWGQDINLIKNQTLGSATWNKGKPYVIYGSLLIDTLETLTIEAGTRVLFHRNASMAIAGSIMVKGSIESPVIFASDRLEKMYEDIPGQWKGILFMNTSTGNNISHAIIRNTVYGIQVGEEKAGTNIPVLKLYSTIISHSTISGLSALKADVEAANCVIYHCGSECIYIGAGGDYTFTYCTIFNRWDYGLRLSPAILIAENPEIPGISISQIHVSLNNSVIYGDNDAELNIAPAGSNFSGNYNFDQCLIKLDTLKARFWSKIEFPGTLINKNPLFIGPDEWDLRPDTLSPLLKNANQVYSTLFPVDIRGVSRISDDKPDIGAFERVTGERKE